MTTIQMMSAKDRVNYYKTTMQPLLGNGNERLQRHWKYLKEVCPDRLDYVTRGACFIGGGAASGGTVAGLTYVCITRPKEKDQINERALLFSMAVGAAIGTYFGFKEFLDCTEKTKYFHTWHQKNKEELINFSSFLQYTNDSFLTQNVCQITQNVLIGPCRTPTGYLVEYQMITSLPKDADGKITCPYTRVKFFDTEVRKDYERALVINKKALYLLEEDLDSAKENPAIVKLLEDQKKFLKESVEECYQNCLIDIEKRRMMKFITFEESQTERNNFVSVFGTDSEHSLDWALDWKGILDGRWSKRYPEEKIY
jgi:hypothetical protein